MRARLLWPALAATLAMAAAGCTARPAAPSPVREVAVRTRQFAFEPFEIRVKKGERVRLKVTSADVTHGFAIVEYGINRQTPPGQPVTVEFVADKPGRFAIVCTVFCGTGHAQHRGILIVEE